MQNYRIRSATMADIPFLAGAIVQAEKSGTGILGLGRLFDLSEEDLLPLIMLMLEEEIDGCDYSVSSFLLAEYQGKPVAAIAGWVEELDGEPPSHQLRANLYGHILPEANLLGSRANRDIIAPLQIEREPLTLQLEHVYVVPEHRGHSLAGLLIDEHCMRAKQRVPDLSTAQIQVMANNPSALSSYEKSGFRLKRTYGSEDPLILDLLPFNKRFLLEKQLTHI